MEYQATKDHLRSLEEEYGLNIRRYKAVKPIPVCCSEYGQPFLSKQISEYIHRLQIHDFRFENEDFNLLYNKYPKCKSALRWWCDQNSVYNICNNPYLKEYMHDNPPAFRVSNMCCEYAKKKVSHKVLTEGWYDLEISGIRKSESNLRSTAYKGCFDKQESCDRYRPLFWYTNSDRKEYEEAFGITHSKCYTLYGLKRTGCACCPFGKSFEQELNICMKYEPLLYRATSNIFKDSIEYTRKYKEFTWKEREKFVV